jgi:hypothetical protein
LHDTSSPQVAPGEHPVRISSSYYLAGLLALAFALFYLLVQSWTQELLSETTDILFIIVSGVCSYLGLLVVHKWGFRGKFGVVHLGLFLYAFLWFAAETTWGIYEVVLHVDVPYPSVADLFYLAAYLPAFLGMGQFLWFFRKGFTPLKLAVAALSGLLIVCFSSVVLLHPLIVESADILTKLFDIGYQLLDTLLIVFAVMMTIVLGKGRFANDWLWITLALILQGAADIAFGYGTLMGWYFSGHPLELVYLYGYLALGLGFVHQTRSLTQ